MRNMFFGAALAAITLASPMVAQAQVVKDTVNGADSGAARGNEAAGPIGGLVGGAIGAGVGAATGAVGTATGVVGSIFGADDRPRFHDYAMQQKRPSFDYPGDVRVGAVLPRRGLTLYPVPADYRVDHRYRYAVVNDRAVIVDPHSRRVVDIID